MVDGFDELIAHLEWMEENIEDDVNTITKNNTMELTGNTIKNERARFDRGYWTGFTARNTTTERIESMHYETLVNTDYAAYLEYGTRYYTGATRFLFDMVVMQRQQYYADLKRLVEG
ncbi:HK97 gp10 family phage protein [Marinococcus halophilus]|uniref:HK97 gp10 family phage protein n=1 Tax=Marinococcus halophilus TaxID=1371 RepID=UPI0009A5D353|nr:HK97 gp10 family phage protein [Marinococcus halophilus]